MWSMPPARAGRRSDNYRTRYPRVRYLLQALPTLPGGLLHANRLSGIPDFPIRNDRKSARSMQPNGQVFL
jgi:hypothetical protein